MTTDITAVNPRPLKILQICDRSHDFAKEFNLLEEVARSFPAPDYAFTYSLLSGSVDEAAASRMGCAVHSFHVPKNKIRGSNLALLWTLFRYIRREGFDVVITHRFKPWLLLALISPFLPRCRFISFLRAFKTFDRRRRQWLAQLLLNRRWRMAAVSEAVRQDLISHGIPARYTAVLLNAININGIQSRQMTRIEARAALGLDPDAIIIGTIGRAQPIKGHQYLVEAFIRIAGRHPQAKLIIIGGGALEKNLRAQAEAAGLGERVILPGAINDGFRYLKAFDLFVLPSLMEGFGLSIAEAIASRVPVTGSHVGGIPEAVGPDGILVESRDSEQLAQAIERILNWSDAQRSDYVERLYQRLVTEFTLEQYHENYRKLVAQVISEQ